MNVFNPRIPLQQLSLAVRNAFIFSLFALTRGQKRLPLAPNWHQRPCRQRQAIRAPGPRLGLQYDKAKDGCQKNRTFHQVIEEVHERFICGYMCMNLSFACIWCNYPCTHAHVCACPCMCVRLTRCCAPVCREH